MSCRSGCPTQDHANWGECARAANIRIGDLDTGNGGNSHRTDKRLGAYQKARQVGLQPPSTKINDSIQTMRKAGA